MEEGRGKALYGCLSTPRAQAPGDWRSRYRVRLQQAVDLEIGRRFLGGAVRSETGRQFRKNTGALEMGRFKADVVGAEACYMCKAT